MMYASQQVEGDIWFGFSGETWFLVSLSWSHATRAENSFLVELTHPVDVATFETIAEMN